MTPLSFGLVLLAEACMIIGQIFFKHAARHPAGSSHFVRNLGIGVCVTAIYFFVWLALLSKFELSYLYPFDGVNRIMMVVGAYIFLKEKATLRVWLGVILISAGVALVSQS